MTEIIDRLTAMLHLSEQHIEELLELGGPVMWSLLAVSVLLWTLVLERYWFLIRTFPALINNQKQHSPAFKADPVALAEIILALNRHLNLIKTLSGILPMLGLLGTVTGIIGTFDLIRIFGSSETHIVAHGIAEALITTMAGLVMGLFGVSAGYDLNRRSRAWKHRVTTLRSPS
jgi:biopolymer transport protein ExbB